MARSPHEEASAFVARSMDRLLGPVRAADEQHVIYHADVDGTCAAACLKLIAEHENPAPLVSTWLPTSDFHFSSFFEQFPAAPRRLYVTADINFSSKSGMIEELGARYGRNFVVIDDHKLNTRTADSVLTVINPNLEVNVSCEELASSLYCYLCLNHMRISVPDWVAVLGLYFDRQLDLYRGMFAGVPERREMDEVVRLMSAPYLREMDPQRDPGLDCLVSCLRQGDDWGTFFGKLRADGALTSLSAENEAEIGRRSAAAMTRATQPGFYKGIPIWYVEFESPLRIANIIASRLRNQLPPGIVVAMRRGSQTSQIEVRVHPDVPAIDTVEMLKTLSERVPLLNFGGHARASGASLRSDLAGSLRLAFVEF